MGCIENHYKKVLQTFAYYLTCDNDTQKAEQLNAENDIEILKEFILTKKQGMSTEKFFYEAGRTSMYVLDKINNNGGCDVLNACIGALIEFENFIGLGMELEEPDEPEYE